MNFSKFIIIFILLIKDIKLMIDYCTTRILPKEPNDCVFFSTNNKKCCFNPKNTTRCFEESSEKGLICGEDYFYNFMKGEDKYKEYKDKKGYCTFNYGGIKGAFEYDEFIKKVLEIKEVKNLQIKCLNNENLKFNAFFFIICLFLIF